MSLFGKRSKHLNHRKNQIDLVMIQSGKELRRTLAVILMLLLIITASQLCEFIIPKIINVNDEISPAQEQIERPVESDMMLKQ